MLKKTIMGVCGLVFVAALSVPAFADQSIGYQQYFNEGVKAFKEHDDQKALRCFKIAQIYDPADKDLNRYLFILDQSVNQIPKQKTLPQEQQQVSQKLVLLDKDIQALMELKKEVSEIVSNEPTQLAVILQVIPQSQPSLAQSQPAVVVTPQPAPAVPAAQAIAQPAAVIPQAAIYVPVEKAKQPAVVLSLAQITNNGQIKPKLQIEYHSSVIIEGKDIQRFLVVDEGFIGVKIIDTDHLEIDASGIGHTFLHIWDNSGRNTFYVEVIYPKYVNSSGMSQAMNGVQHGQPFRVTYTNDWYTYYSGKNIPALKRQSYDFNQTLTVTGETPYGFFDTSGSYSYSDSISDFDTYTIGLSQIPLEGTSNFNLRGFDATRYLSPLTMPGTTLRGAFADVDLMGDVLGLSVSHGQEQETQGFMSITGNKFTDSYIDAVKLTLFPKSNSDQYSFNYAMAYGADHPGYLTEHVYSVQGQHQFNDYLTLNAEQATDSSHDASLASLKWQDGTFNTGLHFRNIDKNYSTVSTLPAYQGETGADWTTEADFKRFTENTFVEAYQNHLYSNLDNPNAFNYDANGNLRTNITKDFWSDSNFNYQDTPGELSPTSSLGLNERLSKSFGIWHSLQGTVFGGVGYQNNHSQNSDTFDYNRKNVIAGVQLPLTRQISSYANYEYDWLDQPNSGGNSNPGIINAGLEYQRQITKEISFNSSVDYHDELGVNANNDSYLSGEESVILSASFNYNPAPDVDIFGDCNASQVLSHTGNPPVDDFEFHLGMRITFGGATYWDPMGTVSGIVFKDREGNGKFVPGDEGVPDVKVKVGDKEAITDKHGRYHVQIHAKGVDVAPVLDTVPGGLLFSTPQILNVRVFQGRTSRADFGLTSQTGIYGIVFMSKNGSNVPNEGDKFISKVKVVLDGKIIQKSDSNGAFYFRKVSPGQHIISIDINTLPLDMVPLLKLKNKIDVAEGTNYMFNIPIKIEKAENEEK